MTPYTWEGPSGGFPGADARLQLDVSQVPARPGPPPLGGVCPSLGLCPVSLVGVGWGVCEEAALSLCHLSLLLGSAPPRAGWVPTGGVCSAAPTWIPTAPPCRGQTRPRGATPAPAGLLSRDFFPRCPTHPSPPLLDHRSAA